MKTYAEHAEECLHRARVAMDVEDTTSAMYWTARAQVYATLALMAETRDR